MAEPAALPAALVYSSSGFALDAGGIWGINVASAGFARALARYSGQNRLVGVIGKESDAAAFAQLVSDVNPACTGETISLLDTARIAEVGTLMLPGPGLEAFGWMRRTVGRRGYSLCGVTHTTATPIVLDTIAGWPTAPVYSWDAVVCTSSAVREMVRTVLSDQLSYLSERVGPMAPTLPQLPIIPLGVECDGFAADGETRKRWRAQLEIGEGHVAALFMGRLSFHGKAHPIPLFQAIGKAAEKSGRTLHLIMAGWFGNEAIEEAYRTAARDFCLNVTVHFLDGRDTAVRGEIWQAADIFVAPMDNVQETFGIAPVEAMAAGLPVIASDWDGLKETVRDGIDGIRVPTVAAPPGAGFDLALRFMAELDDGAYYIGHASQATAIDVACLAEAIGALASDDERRRAMGTAARERARAAYDWPVIIKEYMALWAELGERRGRAGPVPELPLHPARPDPFHAFRNYPTRLAGAETRVTRTELPTAMLDLFYDSPMVSFAHGSMASREELAQILGALEQTTRIGALLETASPMRQWKLWRGVVWLAKFGFVTLED